MYVKRICKIENCNKVSKAKSFCYTHLNEFEPNILRKIYDQRNAIRKCRIEGCGKKQQRKGFCSVHLKEKYPKIWKQRRDTFDDYYKIKISDPLYKEKRRLDKNRTAVLMTKRWKETVLNHYSNGQMKCACCGELHEQFLSIDHVNGRTAKDNFRGHDLYAYLIRNKFPAGYRVLCHNCNQSYGYFRYCPHTISS